jgi:putative ABC transport system permease protein
MLQDFRFALRLLHQRPWFALAVILTLALGIGINTTVFTFVNAVLFKPVPIHGGERIVTVNSTQADQPDRYRGVSWPEFVAFREQNQTFEGLHAASFEQAILSESSHPPERYQSLRVTPGLFDLLRTPPVLGRGFTAADGEPGAEEVVLIGHTVWKNRYQQADVTNRPIQLNGRTATIIGVMPEKFRFPSTHDVWLVLRPTPELEKRDHRPLTLFGLTQPGASVEQANLELNVIATRLPVEPSEAQAAFAPRVRSFHDTYNGEEVRVVFLMMLGAVGFVLLIACANVANMMLARGLSRSREMSVRAALGASRAQLIRQMLVESVLLSCLGGLAGLGLAVAGVHAFDLATQDVGRPYWVRFEMDYVVFAYFAIVSISSGLIFGLVPALRASRIDLHTSMKSGLAGGSPGRQRLAGALVVFQFALTVVLLASAGMMVRSFFGAQSLNAFVPATQIFSARLHLPEGKGDRYEEATARRQFFDDLQPRLAALPGVTRVAFTSHLPGEGGNTKDIELQGHPRIEGSAPLRASYQVQGGDFFRTLNLPLLSGRTFNAADGETDQEAAIVTRSFAALHWPGQDAVGQRFRFLDQDKPGPWITIVGVSADLAQGVQRADAPPLLFLPYRQESWGWMSILLHTHGDAAALNQPLRTVVQGLDDSLPLFETRPLNVALERQRWFLGVFGTLFLVFALSGLLMAGVGIYAVLAHNTGRRTREIGIRMALGATKHRVLRLVIAQGLHQLAIGSALGLLGGYGAAQLLGSVGFLIGTSPNDPVVFLGTIALLAVIGVTACWIPARRASQIQPTEALRTE